MLLVIKPAWAQNISDARHLYGDWNGFDTSLAAVLIRGLAAGIRRPLPEFHATAHSGLSFKLPAPNRADQGRRSNAPETRRLKHPATDRRRSVDRVYTKPL